MGGRNWPTPSNTKSEAANSRSRGLSLSIEATPNVRIVYYTQADETQISRQQAHQLDSEHLFTGIYLFYFIAVFFRSHKFGTRVWSHRSIADKRREQNEIKMIMFCDFFFFRQMTFLRALLFGWDKNINSQIASTIKFRLFIFISNCGNSEIWNRRLKRISCECTVL